MAEEKKKTEYPIKTFRMSEEVYLSLKEERLLMKVGTNCL